MSFKEILNSNKLVLVDFYADWCSPCKMMPPILKNVKNSLGEEVKIIKINVDKNPQIASLFNIRSIPTIMLFKEGKNVWTNTGVSQANLLIEKIKEHN